MTIEYISSQAHFKCDAAVVPVDKLMPEMTGGLLLGPVIPHAAGRMLYACYTAPAIPAPGRTAVHMRISAAGGLLRSVIKLADTERLQSISIPLSLFTGTGDIRTKELSAVSCMLHRYAFGTSVEHIYMVIADDQTRSLFSASQQLRQQVDEFCCRTYVQGLFREPVTRLAEDIKRDAPLSPGKHRIPDSALKTDDSFGIKLDRLMEKRGMSPGEFVRRANISRQTLSKLRRSDAVPEKYTALACAIALELNLEETRLLLESAGYCLSASLKMDVIVAYFIDMKWYDIDTINIVLFENGIRQLGARS